MSMAAVRWTSFNGFLSTSPVYGVGDADISFAKDEETFGGHPEFCNRPASKDGNLE